MVGDGPHAGFPGPGGEPDCDASRDTEQAQHDGHRARVVLAVARPGHLDEVDERWLPGRGARRPLLVAEAALAAKPALEQQRRLVGRACPRRAAPCLLPERLVGPERLVPLVGEQAVDRRFAPAGAIRLEPCATELEVAPHI
jgi:hypothetical protein